MAETFDGASELMKKLLYLTGLILCWCPFASAQIAYVTSSAAGNSTNSGGTTLAVTIGAALAAGDTVYCDLYDTGSASESDTITDSDSNTYHKDKSQSLATDGDTFGLFHADNISVTTTTTPTVTGHGVTINGLLCAGFSGLATSSLDKTASANTSGTSVTSGNTATLSQANELVIGAVAIAFSTGGTTTMTIGSGFTSLFIRGKSTTCTSGSACTSTAIIGLEYEIVSSTTAVAGTWTYSASDEYSAIVGTYEQASVASNPTMPPVIL
jgi:hypothetical protein